MADSDPERSRRYRDKKRGKPPREPKPCPSYACFRRNQRRRAAGKPTDCTDPEGCKQAYTDYQRKLQQAKRAREQP